MLLKGELVGKKKRTKIYDVGDSPFTDSMPLISDEKGEELAKSYLIHKQVEGLTLLSLEFKSHFLHVYYFEAYEIGKGRTQGWIIGGGAPHLLYGSREIQTALEALALYTLHLSPWLDAKGVDSPESSIPDYALPPDWQLVDYWHGFKASRLGGISNHIAWKVLGKFHKEILHPEIRERCQSRGWIPKT